ncbi:MAG TPA: tetratricopeptide repeat protein [Gemmatimonadaceae bacterium]|jgi:tetratricopeptide (TPR) repeat protein|nr:tetratricopeptide repeat protein [Gemmatimonadaceae bacterium]
MQKTDNVERARKLVGKAREAEQLEENGKALSLYDDALSEFTAESLDPFIPEVLRWKGTLLREKGETEAAFRCYTMSLDRARIIGSEAAQAHALNCLGTVAQRRCDLKETDRLYAEAANLAGRAGDSRLLGMIEQNRGVLASMRGDFAQAAAFYSNSLGAFEMACDSEPMSWVLNNLGILHTKIRNFDEAREYLERGLAIAVNRDDAVVENVIRLNLAEVWLGAGRLDLADGCCAEALDQAQRRGDHLTAAGSLKIRAAIERQRGALDKSIATLRIAIYEAEGAEDRLLHAEMLRELGEISRAVGNAGAARSAFREAVESYTVIGANQEVSEVRAELRQLPG